MNSICAFYFKSYTMMIGLRWGGGLDSVLGEIDVDPVLDQHTSSSIQYHHNSPSPDITMNLSSKQCIL